MKKDEGFDKRQVMRGLGWTSVSKLFGQAATFSTTLFLVRLVDKDAFGLFAMAMLYNWLIDNITNFGFQSAIIQRKNLDEDTLSSCFWALSVVSLAAVAVNQILAPWIAALFAEERLTDIVRQISWVFLVIPITILSSAILSRQLRLDNIAKAELGATVTRCAIALVLALAGMGVLSLVYSYIVERIFLGALLARAARWKPRLLFVSRNVMPLLSFGLNITASNLLWLGYSKIDTFIISRFLGAETLGIYSIASQIAMAFPQFISAVYYRTFFPLFSKSQGTTRFNETVLRSSVYLSAIALPMALGIAVVAHDIVFVFLGDKWQDAIPVLQVLSLVAAMQILSGLLPQAINAIGRADIGVWINLASVVMFGIGFYLGARWQGLSGILVVWLILAPLRYVANVASTCSLLRLSVVDFLRAHVGSFMATLIMLPLLMIAAESINDWPAASRLFLCVTVGASVYTALSFLFMRQPCKELFAMLKTPTKDAV